MMDFFKGICPLPLPSASANPYEISQPHSLLFVLISVGNQAAVLIFAFPSWYCFFSLDSVFD